MHNIYAINDNSKFETKLYDKRDAFPSSIVCSRE